MDEPEHPTAEQLLKREVERICAIQTAGLTKPGIDAKTKALMHATSQIRCWISIHGDPYGALSDLADECDAALGITPSTSTLGG